MAEKFKRFVKGIVLQPETSNPSDNIEGSIWHTQEELLGTITAIIDGGSGNANITVVGHGLKDNNKVVIANSDSVPLIDGTHTITRIDSDTFSIPSITITTPGTTGDFTRTQNRIRMYLSGEVREMITDDQVQTIINKALQDSSSKIIDDLDETKEFQFQLEGQTTETKTTLVTTSTTDRTLTLPDADDTLVGLETSDLLKNKSFEDSSTIIVDDGDNTKTLDFQLSGATTSTKTTLNLAQTTDRTINFPDADDTLLGRNTTDTVTNKLFNQDILPLTDDNNSVGSQLFRYQSIFLDDASGLRVFQDTSTEVGRVNGELSGLTVLSVGAFELKLQSENQTSTTVSQAVSLQSGDTEDGNSANVTVKAGVPSGSGTRGDVIIDGNNIQFLADTGISGVANDTLSNLINPTSINQDLLPDITLSQDLGSSSLKFAELHTTSITDDGTDLTLSTQNLSLNSTADLNFQADGDGTANDNLLEIRTSNNALYTGGVLIQSGDATSNDSGDITLVIGSAGGTKGQLRFQDGSEGTIGHVWQSTGVNGEGAWAANPAIGANDTLSNLSSPTDINQDFITDLATWNIQSANNADTNATATGSLVLKTGNKTAGTGDSGSFTIQTGTSAGGTRGGISFSGQFLQLSLVDGIAATLTPQVDNFFDLGTTSKKWRFSNVEQRRFIRDSTTTVISTMQATNTVAAPRGNDQSSRWFTNLATGGGADSGILMYTATKTDTNESGDLEFQTGNNTNGVSGNTGSIAFRTGNSTSGDSGNIVLDPGTASGTRGIISTTSDLEPSITNLYDLGNGSMFWLTGYITTTRTDFIDGDDLLTVTTEQKRFQDPNDSDMFIDDYLRTTTTTDATETTLFSFDPGTTDDAFILTAKVLAQNTSTLDTNGYTLTVVAKDSSGSMSIIGSPTLETNGEEDLDWDITADVSAGSLRVRVTGEAATTVKWVGKIELVGLL